MKSVKYFLLLAAVILAAAQFSSCTAPYVSGTMQYTNPAWAPAYAAGTRYYYLPDIETYYDLSSQDFVYLDNGQWQFSAGLPSMYNDYNLYSGFAVSLNNGVYQPWMHHHLYVSNYPRYYYRNLYHDAAGENLRGFNENRHAPVYTNKPHDNSHPAPPPVNRPANIPGTRPAQNTHYYGKNIGQPVRVQRQMREPRPTGDNHGHH